MNHTKKLLLFGLVFFTTEAFCDEVHDAGLVKISNGTNSSAIVSGQDNNTSFKFPVPANNGACFYNYFGGNTPSPVGALLPLTITGSSGENNYTYTVARDKSTDVPHCSAGQAYYTITNNTTGAQTGYCFDRQDTMNVLPFDLLLTENENQISASLSPDGAEGEQSCSFRFLYECPYAGNTSNVCFNHFPYPYGVASVKNEIPGGPGVSDNVTVGWGKPEQETSIEIGEEKVFSPVAPFPVIIGGVFQVESSSEACLNGSHQYLITNQASGQTMPCCDNFNNGLTISVKSSSTNDPNEALICS